MNLISPASLVICMSVASSCIANTQEVKANPTAIEQRIRRIEDDILPPVLVSGDSREQQKLSDRMAALKVPGLSVAVIHNGKIEWARGYGVITDRGAAVTPTTLFQAASISKAISALATLRAVQSGRLDLDKDVNQYLKHWKVPSNNFTDQTKVTIRELLSHTAGTTVHGFPGYSPNAPLPTLVQILNGAPPANTPEIRVDILPGTQWRYSGGGYVVIQQLLEDITVQPFSKFVKDTVLAPIGMNHSTFDQSLPKNLLVDAAMPFDSDGKLLDSGPHIYPEEAPAGLWTTPSDLARYAIEVQRSLKGKSKRVLSQAMTRQMLSPGKNNWGLGLNIGGSAPHQYFQHGGANAGYQCGLIAYQGDDGAVLMTNSDNGNTLINEVVGTIAHVYGWADFQPTTHSIAKIDPKSFDLLVGSYQLAPQFILTFTREGNRFFSQATHQGQVEIYPENEHQYFAKAVGAQVTFQTDSEGRATGVILRQNGREMPGGKLDETMSKALAEAFAANNKRVRDQVALPGSESAVRRLMGELASGKPDYEKMSPMLAELTRQNLEQLQKIVVQLGAVQSVAFKEVHPDGADVYRVACEHGAVEWGVLLSPDGKIDDASFQVSKWAGAEQR